MSSRWNITGSLSGLLFARTGETGTGGIRVPWGEIPEKT